MHRGIALRLATLESAWPLPSAKIKVPTQNEFAIAYGWGRARTYLLIK